nr:hypothetical protein BC938DRAFT_472757 [Ipomoea batatas]GME01689.1 hypothetical protein BC938DRAFT_472757 [Ipomoea batatas]
MVHCLHKTELAHWWEHAKRVTSQEYNVLRVRSHAWDLRVRDVFNGISCSSVLCNRFVFVIHLSCVLIEHHILQYCPELDGIPDIRLFLS